MLVACVKSDFDELKIAEMRGLTECENQRLQRAENNEFVVTPYMDALTDGSRRQDVAMSRTYRNNAACMSYFRRRTV